MTLVITNKKETSITMHWKEKTGNNTWLTKLRAFRDDSGCLWRKVVNVFISVFAIILVFAGLSIAAWVSRPYITFLFSTSKIEALEKKAELLGQLQQEQANKADLVQRRAGIPEQFKEDKERVEISNTTANPPGSVQKDELKENVVSTTTTTEIPKQVGRGETKKSVVLTARTEIPEEVKKDDIKKTEPSKKISDLFERVRRENLKHSMEVQTRGEREWKALEERGKSLKQVQENWIIIPTVGVDAPILEGLTEENLELGVSRVSKSAKPGHGGNCIIEGHNLGNFGWWRPQGPFIMLEVLEKGVRIYVFYNGKKYVYRVKEQLYRDADAPNLYDFSKGERLTLVTCTTTWDPTIDTDKRTVVVAYPE